MSDAVRILQELSDMPEEDERRGKLHVELCFAVSTEGRLDVVREMLTSDNAKLVRDGICVADEIGRRNRPLLDVIVPLLQHEEFCVKFDAINAILDGAGEDDGVYICQVFSLLHDPEADIRWAVMNFLLRKRTSELRAALQSLEVTDPDSEHVENLRWMLSLKEDSEEDIINRLNTCNATGKMYAVIAAGRLAPKCMKSIHAAANSANPDVKCFANYLVEIIQEGVWPLVNFR